jgi:hypothetical protein
MRAPAGLYTESVDRKLVDTAENGFRLLLPYVVGANGFARKSDGQRFQSHAELYQHGYYVFGGERYRAQRLVRLFEKWVEMVESGHWAIDEHGVMGGIDKFKEADREGTWQHYWIESSW